MNTTGWIRHGPLMAKLSCTIGGVNYESISAAGKALGIGFSMVHYRLHSYNYPEYVSEYHPKEESKTFIPFTIRGVEYATIADAAKKLGENTHWILKKIAVF